MSVKIINIFLFMFLLVPGAKAQFGTHGHIPVQIPDQVTGQVTGQITGTVRDSIAKNLSKGLANNPLDNLVFPRLKISNSSGQVKDIKLSLDRQYLFLILQDGTARVWDLELGVQRPMIKLSSGGIEALAFDTKQQILFSAKANLIYAHDILTASEIYRFPVDQDKIVNLDFSSDNEMLLVNTGDNIELWHLKSKTRLWNKPIDQGKLITAKLFANQQFVVLHKREGSFFSSKDWLEIVSLKTGDKIQSLSNEDKQIISVALHPSGLEVGYQDGQVVIWDARTAKQKFTKTLDYDLLAMKSIANGIYVYVDDNGQAVISHPDGNQLILKKKDLAIKTAFLLQNGRRVITAMDNGLILLWDATTGKELTQMISTKQGWTVIDSFGRFDSSENGMKNVSWVAADQDIPLDNFSGKYYEPGLLMTALTGGEYINKEPDEVKKGITLPPKLELKLGEDKGIGEKIELTVDVFGQGGGVGKVSLFHNAKAMPINKILQDKKEFIVQNKQRYTMRLVLKPVAGKNKIKVVATNTDGIEGLGVEAEFHHKKSPVPATMRVITVGVNQYQDQRLNLDYSVADAETISNLMKKTKLIGFKNVNKFNLYNAHATKLSILSSLNQASQGAQEDVMAIYFAGHGISVNGEWYFLPYETTLQPDLNYFATVGISATELSEIFMDSNIKHIFLMVDSCYSGESISSFRRLQNSQRHFSRAISRSVGITVLTATRRDQEAAELTDLGHGLFTYVVAKGMKGDADWWPKNKQVSVHELATFSTKTIPEFSKKYLDAAQEPTAFTMGEDFPLFDVK